MAAVLASGSGAVLSHWSAAALWQIRPNSRSRIDVTVTHRSRSSKAIWRHVSEVPGDERAVEEGVPVTSVHRTIFDLAPYEEVDAVALERLKEEPSGRRRSKLEIRFAPFLRRHHLPLPRFNDWISLGPKRFQVDCHWPGTGRIVELDGWQGHRTRSAFRDDRERDRRLTAAGYTVTRLTWNQVEDEPEQIAADLRALLAA